MPNNTPLGTSVVGAVNLNQRRMSMPVYVFMMAFILGGLLIGCTIDDRIKADYRLVKADAGALKGYLRASPTPQECPTPGTEEARICKYKFKVNDISGNMVRGTVARSVVKKGYDACIDVKSRLLKDDKATTEELKAFPCFHDDPNTKYDPKAEQPVVPYNYVEYGFEVEGAPENTKRENWKNRVLEIESIPQKKSLKYVGIEDDELLRR